MPKNPNATSNIGTSAGDEESFREAALNYHAKEEGKNRHRSKAGKLEVVATKRLDNQRDLALAYSPGVAYACEEIVKDPLKAGDYTARANLVGVVTNGSAVLGLGNIGALASKPVMEGKAVLFKKFAGIDVFDIEVDAADPQKFIDVVSSLEPTFGGINLEDIKAPECFQIENTLKNKMKIPVFHDDQHGTAIIVAAAVTNALRLVEKDLANAKIVTSGAGAAAIACLDLLVSMGAKKANIWVTDIEGVLHSERLEGLDEKQRLYRQVTDYRTLGDVVGGADIFLGVSAPKVLKKEMVARMAPKPFIMALANPTPEILPEEIKEVRQDAIIATGRSDYPNQVNNVLCFPYIFRGALDVGATRINEAMKIACVKAIADLAMAEPSEIVAKAYSSAESLIFGPNYLIPKPFDPRLLAAVAPAVARAAMESGVATRPIEDFLEYTSSLEEFVFRSGLVMRPLFEKARQNPKKVLFAEGEEERILRAVQAAVDDRICHPVLIGDPTIIARKILQLGLRIRAGRDYEVIDMVNNPGFKEHWELYHKKMQRRGISPDYAEAVVRSRPTVLGSLMLENGEVDGMICGSIGRYHRHLAHINDIIGKSRLAPQFAAMNALVLNQGTYFICDTHVNPEPSADVIACNTVIAADYVERFAITPKIALLSHSDFGSYDNVSARKMQRVKDIVNEMRPDLEIEGEMHGDTAMEENIRERLFPNSALSGEANLLVMPTLDAANIAYTLLKSMTGGQNIGPLLLGAAKPVHILTPSTTVRGILNMTALVVADAKRLY